MEIDQLRAILDKPHDAEVAHSEADAILLLFLRDHGFSDIADTYEEVRDKVGFWYA